MVSASGFAENFDAVTGEGLRDRAYTWTASAFLVMCHEFLSFPGDSLPGAGTGGICSSRKSV